MADSTPAHLEQKIRESGFPEKLIQFPPSVGKVEEGIVGQFSQISHEYDSTKECYYNDLQNVRSYS